MRLNASTLVVALLLCSACEEERAPREWQPEDHQPPSGEDPSQAQPAQGGAGVAAAAAALWRVNCAGCHGVEGRGDGPSRPPVATVPDLTSAALQDDRTDEEMAAVIREGRGMMPGFGSQLNERAVEALVAHTRTLRHD